MRVPDLDYLIEKHETRNLMCRNCGRQLAYHIKVYDFPSWSWEFQCVVRYPGKAYSYESS